MIPKIIHYCWFGKNKKSVLIKRCIASWKEYMPDYKIIEWNEDNFDVNQNEYVKEAYRLKKWAYVSDYARMYVLYNYGGIYFDTDVEMIKPIPHSFLELNSFSCIEEFSLKVNPGLVYACHKNDPFVKTIIDTYSNDKFTNDPVNKIKTINIRITEILDKYGYIAEDKKQEVMGLAIFPSSYFCGYDGKSRRISVKPDTICVHHYAASWLPWHRKVRKFFGDVIRHVLYKK